MKIQDHLPLTEGIVKINARKFFAVHLQKHFSSLREQSNYRRLFSQALSELHYSPMLPSLPIYFV